MPQGPGGTSPLMKPFVVLALPGMYLFYKYSQYKRRRKENQRRKLTEKELQHLNNKIEKLLSQLEENEPELATSQEEECVICIHAKATMLTSPCGHQVVCRKCFVKTIQIAVSQRLLPLRCVICRAKILRLKTGPLLPTSASGYSVTSRTSVPASDSLYSVSSGGSSLSSCSSTAGEHVGPCCGGRCMGARPRQPSGALRRSQQQAMKARLQEYTVGQRGRGVQGVNRLPVIRESSPSGGTPPPSTRIRCAQKIVTQLESTPILTTTKNGYKYAKLPQDDLDGDGDAFQLEEVIKKPARTPEKDKQWPARTPDKDKHWWSRSKSEEKVDNRRNELTERQMLLKEMAGGKGKACSVGDDRV